MSEQHTPTSETKPTFNQLNEQTKAGHEHPTVLIERGDGTIQPARTTNEFGANKEGQLTRKVEFTAMNKHGKNVPVDKWVQLADMSDQAQAEYAEQLGGELLRPETAQEMGEIGVSAIVEAPDPTLEGAAPKSIIDMSSMGDVLTPQGSVEASAGETPAKSFAELMGAEPSPEEESELGAVLVNMDNELSVSGVKLGNVTSFLEAIRVDLQKYTDMAQRGDIAPEDLRGRLNNVLTGMGQNESALSSSSADVDRIKSEVAALQNGLGEQITAQDKQEESETNPLAATHGVLTDVDTMLSGKEPDIEVIGNMMARAHVQLEDFAHDIGYGTNIDADRLRDIAAQVGRMSDEANNRGLADFSDISKRLHDALESSRR